MADERDENLDIAAGGSNGAENVGDGERIVKTTIISLFWVLVAGVLLFTCFINFFPYNSMKLYSEMGIKVRALESAEKYLQRSGKQYNENNYPLGESKYYDALVFCIDTSTELMRKTDESIYAEKVVKYVDRYAELDRTSSERSAIIDEYYRANAFAAFRPQLYSYNDTLACRRAEALLRLGEHKLLFEELRTEANFIRGFEGDKFSKNDMQRAALLLNRLNVYMNFEFKTLGLSDKIITEGNVPEFVDLADTRNRFEFFINDTERNPVEQAPGYTWIYTGLNGANMDKLRDDIVGLSDEREPKLMLEKLYYVKALSDFMDNMVSVGIVLEINSKSFPSYREQALKVHADWGGHNRLGKELDGHPDFEPVSSWYDKTLLPRYIRDVA